MYGSTGGSGGSMPTGTSGFGISCIACPLYITSGQSWSEFEAGSVGREGDIIGASEPMPESLAELSFSEDSEKEKAEAFVSMKVSLTGAAVVGRKVVHRDGK